MRLNQRARVTSPPSALELCHLCNAFSTLRFTAENGLFC